MKALQHPALDPLLFGSPLRRPAVAAAAIVLLVLLLLAAAAMAVLTFATMGTDGTSVFARALAASSVLSLVPLAALWWLDRRERESPWLYAIAFLWGGVIASWLSMPLNTLILVGIEHWVAQHPQITQLLGVDAARLIGAPLAAPLVEESAKGI